MGMAQYDEAIELVHQRQDDAEFAGSCDATIVEAAEVALGIAFPPIYRRFVSELGAGGIGSEEIYGITSNNIVQSAVPNGIWLTLKIRARSALPLSMVILNVASDGQYAVLNTAEREANDECAVVVWDSQLGVNQKLEIIAPDFGTYFLSIVQKGIASLDEDE